MVMKYDVPLPRVVDKNGNELRRLNVIDASVNLSLIPLSTAQITLPIFENLNVRDWVQMYTSQGSVGIFRVRSPGQNYRMETKQYTLDHGIVELGDYIIKGEVEFNAAANSVITSIFSHYTGGMWALGTVTPTQKVEYSGDHEDILTALMYVMDQLPDYMMQFDQTTKPWILNIVSRPQTVTGEGRLSRNVVSARISEDDSRLCPRILSPNLPNGQLDADTLGTYGVVERFFGKDDEQSQEEFVADCNKYLAQHKKPLLSVNLELRDLEQITGEALDNITVGDLYRLALPDYNTTIEQPVISLSWRSVYSDPGAVSVTLAHEEMTMSSAFSAVAGASAGGFDSLSSLSNANKNIKVVREEVKLKADQTYVTGLERRVDTAEIAIDAQGVEIGSTRESVNVLSGRVTQDEATLTVHANEIAARVTQTEFTALGNVVASHTSELSVQADQISSKVSQTDYNGNTIASLINQTATTVTIQAQKIDLQGYVTASQLAAAFSEATLVSTQRLSVASSFYINGAYASWQSTNVVLSAWANKSSQRAFALTDGSKVTGTYYMEPVTGIGTNTQPIFYLGRVDSD